MADYPFPPKVGSGIVAYNSMKYLSNKYEIDLICLKPHKNNFDTPDFPINIELVDQKPYYKFTRNLFFIANVLSINSFWSNFMKFRVEKKCNSSNYQAIILFEINSLQYCPSAFYQKVIANIEDPLSIKFKRMVKLSVWSVLQKAKLWILSKLACSYEKRVLPKLSKVLLLSQADVNDMKKDGVHKNLIYMPYGVETSESRSNLSFQERQKAIVFSGNMYHPPNVDGVLHFLSDIYPIILNSCPDVVFWIVGSNPDKKIFKSAEKYKDRVLITGRVDSVKDYIQKATVSICPIRLKIGVQTKILEAMSIGTPVVSTSAGNSGICGVSGRDLWVEDEPDKFANRVIDLLNGNGWNFIAENGINLTETKFTWEKSASQLNEEIKSLTLNINL